MKNIVQRSITGALLLAVIIGSIILSKYSFFACVLLLLVFSLIEVYDIMAILKVEPLKWFGIFVGIGIFGSSFAVAQGIASPILFVILIPLFLVTMIVELYRKKEQPFLNIASTFLGIIYIAVPFSLFNFIVFSNYHNHQYSFALLLCLFSFNWVNDTGAYLSGMTFGKHKLFERISPKKSWEGAVGGAASVVGIAFLFAWLIPEISLFNWIVLGLVTCVFGVFGDLMESLLKRSAGIKDSGRLLPGHGGFLDRFDAVIFSAPAFFAYLLLVL